MDVKAIPTVTTATAPQQVVVHRDVGGPARWVGTTRGAGRARGKCVERLRASRTPARTIMGPSLKIISCV